MIADHLYGRALFEDLTATPLTPLTRTLGAGAALPGVWGRAFRRCGLLTGAGSSVELRGGYPYLNISMLRLLGRETICADARAFAELVMDPRSDVPRRRETFTGLGIDRDRVQAWIGRVRRGPSISLVERARAALLVCRAARPDLAECSDTGLVARMRAVRPLLAGLLYLHAQAELASVVTVGMLEQVGPSREAADVTLEVSAEPGDTSALRLLDQINEALVGCGRLAEYVEDSPEATAAALSRAPARGEPGVLRQRLGVLLDRWGHCSQQSWELASPSWDCSLAVPLRVCAALRTRSDRSAERRKDAPPASPRPDLATRWLRARAEVMDLVARCVHEQRLAARELGRRHHASGLLDSADQICMVRDEELDPFVIDPELVAATARLRSYDQQATLGLQAPCATLGPPARVVSWPPAATSPRPLRTGEQLWASASSPGKAAGPARILRSVAEAEVSDGDVLVLESAADTWWPYLPLAAAVVCEGGAYLSDLAFRCRQRGIPCLTGAVGARKRIPAGHRVHVDAAAGTAQLAW